MSSDENRRTRIGTPPPGPRAASSSDALEQQAAGSPESAPIEQTGGQGGEQAGAAKAADSEPAAVETTPPATSYTTSTDPLVGQVLAGRYVIDKKLGEGGMGSVYLATHVTLEKQVALKILHGEFARKSDLVERFLQEAKAASRIRHENVIDITDFGMTDDGLVFFAMELLNGHDLHDEIARARIEGRALPWSRMKPVFLQICAALTAAHASNVIHRDLKPENIYLVKWLGHSDFVKLLDFGIAKLTETTEGDRKLTRTGMLFGTPEYMSPEQARGDKVDHRVDVYAMGCILYQLIAGKVPFYAENFMGILSLHLTEEVPDIADAAFAASGAPKALRPVLRKALAKAREDRYSTIAELAEAVSAASDENTATAASGEGAAKKTTTKAGAPTIGQPASNRARKTNWTGRVTLPTDSIAPELPVAKKQPPWVVIGIGAVALIGGGIFVATRGGESGTATAPPPPAEVATAGPGEAPPVSATVQASLSSNPAGASIVDGDGKVLGMTPATVALARGDAPIRLVFRLEGHHDKIIELAPLDDFEYLAELVAGAQAKPAVVEKVAPSRPSRPQPGSSSATTAVGKPTEKLPEKPTVTIAPETTAGDRPTDSATTKPGDTVAPKPGDTGAPKPGDNGANGTKPGPGPDEPVIKDPFAPPQ